MKRLIIKALTAIFAPMPESKANTQTIQEVGEFLTKLAANSSFYEYSQIHDFEVLTDAMLNEHYANPLCAIYKRRIENILRLKHDLINWQMPQTEKR